MSEHVGAPHEHAPSGGAAFEHLGVSAEHHEPSARGARWAVVTARFNGAITADLYQGAVQALVDAGADAAHIHAISVPGAVEIPLVARDLAATRHYAGIIALGCVIRGETAHFEYVCDSVTQSLGRVQLDTGVPIGFGVLTVETVAQAQARSETTHGGHNVGADAARAAVEVAGHLRAIRSS